MDMLVLAPRYQRGLSLTAAVLALLVWLLPSSASAGGPFLAGLACDSAPAAGSVPVMNNNSPLLTLCSNLKLRVWRR